ncbi:MAG: Holliday junction resolvase RuvX [Gammaproteobacteria bacterium]|nr:Holliday junction resolvase RuvX [Gammaproteobacteria bacterium]
MNRPNLLCFDYGEKRIGVAVGQNLTATATPLEIIESRRGRPDWRRISVLIRDWQPQALIVGNPLNMDGSRQPVTDAADRFARQLAGRFGLPVHRADERLSTFEATQRTGMGSGVDAVAAQAILETWLAGQAAPGRPPAGSVKRPAVPR